MSAAYPTVSRVQSTTSSFSIERIAGFAGLSFALIVGAVNVVVGALSPPAADASASEIVSFFADNDTVLKAAIGVVPFPVIALFLF